MSLTWRSCTQPLARRRSVSSRTTQSCSRCTTTASRRRCGAGPPTLSSLPPVRVAIVTAPASVIIEELRELPAQYRVADFGCGEAKIAASFACGDCISRSWSAACRRRCFRLILWRSTSAVCRVSPRTGHADASTVTACDMSSVPLESHSVEAAVFCLSLMGTNYVDGLGEAHRVLKSGGLLKVAEACLHAAPVRLMQRRW